MKRDKENNLIRKKGKLYIKINASRYKRCEVTPHFPKTKKSCRNSGIAIMIDNNNDRHDEKLPKK